MRAPPDLALLRSTFAYDADTGAVTRNGRVAGYVNDAGYVCMRFFGREVRAHQVGWALTHGEWPDREIDHANGVRNDNRLVNLRLCTRAQNMMNARKITRPTSSRCKGVFFHKGQNRWRAAITVGGKIRTLGNFMSEEAAAQAYATAAKEHFGQFARIA